MILEKLLINLIYINAVIYTISSNAIERNEKKKNHKRYKTS